MVLEVNTDLLEEGYTRYMMDVSCDARVVHYYECCLLYDDD